MGNLKDIIREQRLNRNLTQAELSRIMGYESPSTISMWESGDRTPDIKDLNKLADYFGVTCDYLLGRDTSTNTA